MKQHTIFETTDGARFDSENEALQHEHMLETRAKVREFLQAEEINARRSSEYERIILAWEARKISDAQHKELTAVA